MTLVVVVGVIWIVIFGAMWLLHLWRSINKELDEALAGSFPWVTPVPRSDLGSYYWLSETTYASPVETTYASPVDNVLSFASLAVVNRARSAAWHADGESWTGADWSNAMCGEAGEAANIVKKIRRIETNVAGRYVEQDPGSLTEKLSLELADIVLYVDLLAEHYAIDLPTAIVRKFNATSEQYGFPQRLSVSGSETPLGFTPAPPPGHRLMHIGHRGLGVMEETCACGKTVVGTPSFNAGQMDRHYAEVRANLQTDGQ